MATDLTGIGLGGAIGLVGGLGGVLIGQLMTSRREMKNRKIEGLKSVVQELNKLSRLSLQIAQYINPLVHNTSPDEIARAVFNAQGWKECTHELQERSWHFSCMAYLPDAFNGFSRLEHLIAVIMDPYAEVPGSPNTTSREAAVLEFNRIYQSISRMIEERLAKLV
jgi:hypothetical protein